MNKEKESEKFYPIAYNFILLKVLEKAEVLEIEIEEEEVKNLSLLNSGLFDSLSFLELLVSIENEFGIEIDLSEKDPEDFTTTNGLALIIANSDISSTVKIPEVKEDLSNDLLYQELTSDHPQWQKVGSLFSKMYASFHQKGINLPLTENGEEIWLKALGGSSTNKTNKIFGCFDNNQLIGYIQATIKLLPAYLQGNTTGFIAGIFIEPEYRRRGIAEKLFLLAENWFKERRVESLELQVLDQNENAIEFWKKTGFNSELIQMRKFLK